MAVKSSTTNAPLKKEDVRITRTKAALSKAFFEMLMETPLEGITVNDLCEHADVRRATFYKHFEDKGDFITFLIKDIREKFNNEAWRTGIEALTPREYYTRYAAAVIEWLTKREQPIRNAANSQMRATFVQSFVQQNYKDTVEHLRYSEENGAKLIAPVEVVASMLIGGLSHCIISWFEAENRCSSFDLILDISKFINAVLP